MKTLLIVGIGPGHPEQITLQGVRAIASTDVFFLFDKGEEKGELVAFREELIARHATERPHRIVEAESPRWTSEGPDYRRLVDELNLRKTALLHGLLAGELQEGERGAILVWGDPALYDSTIRLAEAVARDLAFEVEIVPGISSLQALAARHAAPWNEVAGNVEITTGRRLAEAMPEARTILVMLDSRNAFLRYRSRELSIRYGAYVGMPDEILIEGPLDAVADEIVVRRAEARERKGWIMDCYMLMRDG